MSFLYQPSKANVVADALSRLSTGSAAYLDEQKKELVRDVHWLTSIGVKLVDSTKGGIMVDNGSESSFFIYVKGKQSLDPIFVVLKEVFDTLNYTSIKKYKRLYQVKNPIIM